MTKGKANSPANMALRRVAAPASSGSVIRRRAPPTYEKKGEIVRVSNFEFLTSLVSASSSADTKGVIYASPAHLTWAGNIGKNYTFYRFRKLKFVFLPMQPTTVAGYIDLAFLHDTEDAAAWAAAAGLNQLEQSSNFVSGPIWAKGAYSSGDNPENSMVVTVDCDILHARVPWFRVDFSHSPGPETAQTDAGAIAWFFNAAATGNIGRLYVEYDLEFEHPISSISNV